MARAPTGLHPKARGKSGRCRTPPWVPGEKGVCPVGATSSFGAIPEPLQRPPQSIPGAGTGKIWCGTAQTRGQRPRAARCLGVQFANARTNAAVLWCLPSDCLCDFLTAGEEICGGAGSSRPGKIVTTGDEISAASKLTAADGKQRPTGMLKAKNKKI